MTSEEQKKVPSSTPQIEGLDLPSVYVSKFHLLVLDNVGRLVLGEQLTTDHPPHFHSAFLFTHADLQSLAVMITALLASVHEKQEAAPLQEAHVDAIKRKKN